MRHVPRLLSDVDALAAVCDLETVGRVSGRPHVIEIWFAASDDSVYMLAGGRERADWVKNLRRTPTVGVRIGGSRFRGEAAVIEGTDEERRARELVAAKYRLWQPGTELTGWAAEALPVAVRIVARAG